MKFQRNARILKGQLDAAPFVALFVLLSIFLLLSSLIYTPGLHLNLPFAQGFAGTDKPNVKVAIDPSGRLYYQNQWVEEGELRGKLKAEAQKTAGLALVVYPDRAVSYEMLVRLAGLAREADISEVVLATLPRTTGPKNGSLTP
jgi:biopolymer transport protein ExbD